MFVNSCDRGNPSIVSSRSLMSCVLAPDTAIDSGTPSPSVRRLRLVPSFALSVGFGPFPPHPKGTQTLEFKNSKSSFVDIECSYNYYGNICLFSK